MYIYSIREKNRCLNNNVTMLKEMELSDGKELMEEQVFLSPNFKTSKQYLLQPVTCSQFFLLLLQFYLEYFRPTVADPNELLLFLSPEGRPARMGKLVTKFYKRTLNLHITITAIRAMVETATQDLLLTGSITGQARQSILNVQGHSEGTMQRFYLKKNCERDAINAAEVFAKIVTSPQVTPRDVLSSPQITPVHDTPSKSPVVGLKHEYNNSSSRKQRFPWSDMEVKIVGEYVERNKQVTNVYSQCLKYIVSNPDILEHFHENHIEDSGRLKYGHDAYKAKKERDSYLVINCDV